MFWSYPDNQSSHYLIVTGGPTSFLCRWPRFDSSQEAWDVLSDGTSGEDTNREWGTELQLERKMIREPASCARRFWPECLAWLFSLEFHWVVFLDTTRARYLPPSSVTTSLGPCCLSMVGLLAAPRIGDSGVRPRVLQASVPCRAACKFDRWSSISRYPRAIHRTQTSMSSRLTSL
jgi:hypothetical protein